MWQKKQHQILLLAFKSRDLPLTHIKRLTKNFTSVHWLWVVRWSHFLKQNSLKLRYVIASLKKLDDCYYLAKALYFVQWIASSNYSIKRWQAPWKEWKRRKKQFQKEHYFTWSTWSQSIFHANNWDFSVGIRSINCLIAAFLSSVDIFAGFFLSS